MSHLIHRILPFTRNPIKSVARNPEIYVSDHAFFQAGRCPEGRIMETIALNHLMRLTTHRLLSPPTYWRAQRGKEVDFVIETGKGIIPIEVKYQSSVSRSDFSGILAFSRIVDVDFAIMVTAEKEGVSELNSGEKSLKVIQIPLWKFLLLN